MIVEKPFGKDSESFAQLERELSNFLSEEQMYRIDHYLGKELIENLTVGAPALSSVYPFSMCGCISTCLLPASCGLLQALHTSALQAACKVVSAILEVQCLYARPLLMLRGLLRHQHIMTSPYAWRRC